MVGSCVRVDAEANEGTPQTDLRFFFRQPKPESGLDCLICATFARKWSGEKTCRTQIWRDECLSRKKNENSAHTRQSRPDYGLRLSQFQYESQALLRCPLFDRKQTWRTQMWWVSSRVRAEAESANSAYSRQSRPNRGFGVSHFQYTRLETLGVGTDLADLDMVGSRVRADAETGQKRSHLGKPAFLSKSGNIKTSPLLQYY